MGERIRELTLTAFRGVPETFHIPLGDGQSLVVFGDNGTGKSTIADALEWYLTGEIELLAHEGRQHAVRHLGAAGELATAVELVTGGELGGRAVFGAAAGAGADDSASGAASDRARSLAGRETFILRGRTLADFINKTKTEKWKSLAEILGLDGIDELRQDLYRVRTELRRRAKNTADDLAVKRAALRPGGDEPDEAVLLSELRQVCAALGLPPPDALDRLADPAWLGALLVSGATSVASQRETMQEDLARVRALPRVDAAAAARWNALVVAGDLPRLRLLEQAQSLLEPASEPDACPLCGQPVAPGQLAARLRAELLDLAQAGQELDRTRAALHADLATLRAAEEERAGIRLRAGLLRLELAPVPPSPHEALQAQLETHVVIDTAALDDFTQRLAAWDQVASALAQATASGEEALASDDQRGLLRRLCQQIEDWRGARAEATHAAAARDLAESVYAAYERRQQAYLTDTLDRINHRVAANYERLHPGEGLGEVSVEPWTAKGVELAITFHGSRQRPPHGVLSESHLNSLAIALFLAMADTFNERVRFLVLDDVINSFDLEHRGSLADLLASKDDWQLIVLTHDRQFFEHLVRRAPGWRALELTSWSFAEGPRLNQYQTRSLLGEARACLERGDTNGAATKTRRALEEQLQEACEALQALLAFRRGAGNDRRELGELFMGLRRALKTYAKGLHGELEPLLKMLEADVGATLNVEAHASRGRAAAGEVEAALDRAQQLDAAWSCEQCGTRIWSKGTPDAARCRCGRRQFPPAGRP